MTSQQGTYRTLSPARRWMCDLVALSQSIPIAALEHRLNLQPIIAAREALTSPRPGWIALFLKAFAIVARNRPSLRQSYFNFPWPRIYEHPISIAAITVEREWRDEPAVFFDILPQPDTMGLMDLQRHLHSLKTEPVESIHTFCRLIRGNILPLPLRRLLWRWLYSFSGPRRATYIGTYAINGGTRFPIRPVTTTGALGTTIYFGMFHPDGTTDVCLTFDHRVMDGGEVVRTLCEIEQVLNTELTAELHALAEARGSMERAR